MFKQVWLHSMIDIQMALELKSSKKYDCAGTKPAEY